LHSKSIYVLILSHEINQFCSSHSLTEIYIDKFDLLDDHLQKALQESVDQLAPGIESKSFFSTPIVDPQVIAVRATKPKIPESVMKNFV
jgi:hypothetical protein